MANTITKLLEPTAIQLQLDAHSSKDVITVLGNQLFKAGHVYSTFTAGALERESHLPTGLELGGKINAAIPHTDIQHVIRPALAMATLKRPVKFHNMVAADEEVAVQIVFVMALKEPHQQVEMLQEIAGVLQNAKVIEALMLARNKNEVMAILEKA
jgi:Phosphotransferase system mannitol/fructose-specific IIA domain (Ntr-type)